MYGIGPKASDYVIAVCAILFIGFALGVAFAKVFG